MAEGRVSLRDRNGLVVATEMTQATGTAGHEAAQAMVEALDPGHRITPGADKGYDTKDFVAAMRRQGVTPHVAQNTKGRRSAIDRRTTRHRGTARVGWMFTLTAAAYNLVRLPRLLGAAA